MTIFFISNNYVVLANSGNLAFSILEFRVFLSKKNTQYIREYVCKTCQLSL